MHTLREQLFSTAPPAAAEERMSVQKSPQPGHSRGVRVARIVAAALCGLAAVLVLCSCFGLGWAVGVAVERTQASSAALQPYGTPEDVQRALREAFLAVGGMRDTGANAAYIPILVNWEATTGQLSGGNFSVGAALLRPEGGLSDFYEGAVNFRVSMQSVSKPITLGAVCGAKAALMGSAAAAADALRARMGIEGDFLPFNSAAAVDMAISAGQPATINPYDNAGAIADASQFAPPAAVAGDPDDLAGSIFARIAAAQRAAMAADADDGPSAEMVPLKSIKVNLQTLIIQK